MSNDLNSSEKRGKSHGQAAIKLPSATTVRLHGQAAIKSPAAITRSLFGQAAIEQPSAAARTLHAQAAMEFLMTYGWAILIMLVVISMLFYLGVFNQSTQTTKSCVLPSGLSCYEFDIDESGAITLDLGQSTGKTITVYGVGCGTNGTPALTTLPAPVTIQSGFHARVTGPSAGISVSCSGASGPSFKGKLAIKYSTQNSNYNKTVYGDISGPLLNASSGGGTFDTAGVWVLVPGNPSIGTSDFYVMKYEAKQNGSNPTSTAAGTPWASITQPAARTACTNIGAHLLTIAEAQTINRDVASVGSNWLSGSVGSGCMYGGHMECDSGTYCYAAFPASSNDAEGWWNGTSASYNPAVQHCPFTISEDRGNETRRTMYLSNGNVLWDWSGNVWEWMNDTCVQDIMGGIWYSGAGWIEWNSTYLSHGEVDAMGPPNSPPIWTANQGVGRYYGCTVPNNAFLRGGGWSSGAYAGAFSLYLYRAPGDSGTNFGFRCARPG